MDSINFVFITHACIYTYTHALIQIHNCHLVDHSHSTNTRLYIENTSSLSGSMAMYTRKYCITSSQEHKSSVKFGIFQMEWIFFSSSKSTCIYLYTFVQAVCKLSKRQFKAIERSLKYTYN